MRIRMVSILVLASGLLLNYDSSSGEEPGAKCIALANVKAIDGELLERIRSFAQAEMDVRVRSFDINTAAVTNLQETGKQLAAQKGSNDVCMIALVLPETEMSLHLAVLSDIQVAIVNVKALYNGDKEKYARRIERQVMRGAGFLFGLEPALDPHCVTRNYSSLEEFDQMGRNFFPPWKDKFTREATRRGLMPLLPFTTKGGQKREQ